jgi:hypothetical protein
MKKMSKIVLALLLAGALPLAGCGDFLEVTNPGPIPDEQLNSPDAARSLVVGMSSDISEALDDLIFANSIMADELAHGGSYSDPGLFYRGIIRPEDVNGYWGDMHRARWVAEQGIERMKSENVLGAEFDKSADAARASLFAGFSNRMLGENVCFAVIDGGGRQDHKVHFQRAERYFTDAHRIAQAVKNTPFATAALAGRAQVRMGLGKWDEAVADAKQVPTGFRFDANYSLNSSRQTNYVVQETHRRFELTVFNTQWADVKDDPRVPWRVVLDRRGAVQRGQDGRTPMYQQLKYTDLGDDIPLAKGTEMRMIEAEAALRKGNIAQAFTLINQQRTFNKMDPLTAPATLEEAWKTLQKERGAVLWLESRRFGDLRRWFNEAGPAHNAFLKGRDKCIPISQNELNSNPNARG